MEIGTEVAHQRHDCDDAVYKFIGLLTLPLIQCKYCVVYARTLDARYRGEGVQVWDDILVFSRSHHSLTLNISQTATDTAIVTIEGE